MIKHIVFFKSAEANNVTKQTIINDITITLRGLKNKISQIISLEVGVNISEREAAFDFSLHTVFANIEDLNIYQNHSEHLKVIEQIKANNLQVAVVDYKVNN